MMTSLSYYITLSISSSTGDIVIRVDAPYHNDPKPSSPRGKLDDLYNYEVVELFFSGIPYDEGSNDSNVPYLEMGIGPHGHYYLIFFMKEGDWDTADNSICLDNLPNINIDDQTNRWTAEILVPFYLLPEPTCGEDLSVAWNFNAYAIHGQGFAREYLAYSTLPNNTDKPNFHQLQYFQHIELYETMEVRNHVDRTHSIANEKLGRISKSTSPIVKNSTSKSEEKEKTITDLLKEDILLKEEDDEDEDEDEEIDKITTEKPFTDTNSISSVSTSPKNSRVKADSSNTTSNEPIITMDEIANQVKASLATTLTKNQIELEEKFQRHVQKDEFVVLHEFVWKRKGISYKKRKLILTSKPRLIYFDPNGLYKGSIQWSMTKRPQLVRVSAFSFFYDIISLFLCLYRSMVRSLTLCYMIIQEPIISVIVRLVQMFGLEHYQRL